MIIYIYDLLAMGLVLWYSCIRWKILGSNAGKVIVTDLHTNIFQFTWWYVPVNFMTAIFSAYFLARTILFLDQSYTMNMAIIAFLLLIRNGWYTFEDVEQYIHHDPSIKQLIFILLDIAMVVELSLWFVFFFKKG